MGKKATKDSTLSEILELKNGQKILAKFNLPCLWCPMMKNEMHKLKIGQICEMYNINAEKLLKELNKTSLVTKQRRFLLLGNEKYGAKA